MFIIACVLWLKSACFSWALLRHHSSWLRKALLLHRRLPTHAGQGVELSPMKPFATNIGNALQGMSLGCETVLMAWSTPVVVVVRLVGATSFFPIAITTSMSTALPDQIEVCYEISHLSFVYFPRSLCRSLPHRVNFSSEERNWTNQPLRC